MCTLLKLIEPYVTVLCFLMQFYVAADAMVATGGSLYIAVGCACVIVVVITVGAFIVYMRTMKARRTDVIQ